MKKVLATCVILVLAMPLFLLPNDTKAEMIESAGDRITVVPAKFELSGNPGDTIEQTLRITNEDNAQSLFAISVQSFGVIGEEGEVVLDESVSPYPNYLAKWIDFPEKGMEFAPKQTKNINFKINIPKDADPGGKYASIVVSMDRVNRNAGEPASTAKVVSLIMLSVSGSIDESLKAESFESVRKTNGNFDFILRASNSGNDHFKPNGTLVVTNIWGRKVDEVPLNGENVLPKGIRRMVTIWHPQKILFGFYHATIVSTYGQHNNKHLNTVGNFWVFPPVLIVGIVIILLVEIVVYVLRYDKKLFEK